MSVPRAVEGWDIVPFPADYIASWREQFGDDQDPVGYRHRQRRLTAILTREQWPGDPEGIKRWHISLRYGEHSKDGRVPTWDEIVNTCHELRPGVPFVMGVPPRNLWLNVHPDVLHAWETKDEALLTQWKINATGQTPT